jgi:hypothetical protein
MTRIDVTCADVDELAAAWALGAVDAAEDRAIGEHLASCDKPHDEAHAAIDGAAVVGADLAPVQPSAALRDRLMATVAATPQDHRPLSAAPTTPAVSVSAPAARPWWTPTWQLPAALAAGALALAVGLGAWGLSLQQQLAERDAAVNAVASADAAFRVDGAAGGGWILEDGERAVFLADELAPLAAGQLYEFWLIDGSGQAVDVGILEDADGLTLVELERPLDDAVAFAVTVETERVAQSANDPVMLASLEG